MFAGMKLNGMYARIKSVDIRNFMSISEGSFEFPDDGNVITFEGYNDSGKSAVLKAVACALMDVYATKQAKWVQDGAEKFVVKVHFEDNTTVVKEKYASGQSSYELFKNEECIFTTKVNKTLTKADRVPEAIVEFLGLSSFEGENLNFRTNIDKLLLVESTGSDNFKFLNEVLHSAEIAEATRLLNEEKNTVNQLVSSLQGQVDSAELALAGLPVFPDGFVEAVESREESLVEAGNGLTVGREAGRALDGVLGVPAGVEVPLIDAGALVGVSRVAGLVAEVDRVPAGVEVPLIDAGLVAGLVAGQEVAGLVAEVDRVPAGVDVPEVSVEGLSVSLTALGRFNEYMTVWESLQKDTQELENLENLKKATLTKAKQAGVYVVECSKCHNIELAETNQHEH